MKVRQPLNAAALVLLTWTHSASAATCGSSAADFGAWLDDFKREAATEAIPMKREYSFQNAPRCSATSKRTRERCKAPAVRGWAVCRFHGARGGAPKGKTDEAYRHGLFTAEAIEAAARSRAGSFSRCFHARRTISAGARLISHSTRLTSLRSIVFSRNY
jgi:hypothetical protein